MTVSSTNTKRQFNGDGSTAAFAYNFKVFADADLQVIVRSSTGVETTKSSGTHYNSSGVGDTSGGTVTFTSGNIPASGETITLIRNKTISQELDLVANDPFPAASLEDQMDKLTHLILQNNEELDRTIKLSKTNTITSTEFTENATSRASKVFAFNTSGEIDLTTEIGVNKGNWAASTTYAVRDIVKDTSTNNIFQVITAHTSSGSQPLTTNTDSGKWFLIVDAATATTSATTATNKAADAGKFAVTAEDSQFTLSDGSTTGFSALHYNAKASAFSSTATTQATNSGNSATAAANSATTASNKAADAGKFATTAEDSQFTLSDGSTTGFSALHYNAKASASASAAASSATSAASNAGLLADVTASAAELNKLDGCTSTTAELNYVDVTTLGTSQASKALTADSNGNVKLSEELQVKSYLETVVALSAAATVTLDLSTANVFTLTTDQNTTFVFNYGNIQQTTNDAFSFILQITSGGSHSLTFPSSVKFAGGTAPDAPASGEIDTYVFYTKDGGTRYDGTLAVDAGS